MKPFEPDNLPLNNINWIKIIKLIGKANYELASFEGILKAMVNPMVLLSPLTTKEAVLSSKIEGTQATLQEVLKFEANPNVEIPNYNDIQEVLNYRKSISLALEIMKKRPLSLNLIRDIHKTLLDSVRGASKAPGEFRREQNWIGKHGSPIEMAYFVPPEPQKIRQYLDNYEKYLHSDENDTIVQLAIIHAQFEIIHPFRDGNGRIGRILIPLFLYEKKMLSQPVFYMSEFLESNREEYYSRLRNITNNGEWQEWIEFFLNGFILQAHNNFNKAQQIIELYENMKRVIHEFNTSFSLPILDSLFSMPFFNSTDFTNFSGVPRASANRLLRTLTKKSIINLVEHSSGRKPSVFMFPKLLSITEG